MVKIPKLNRFQRIMRMIPVLGAILQRHDYIVAYRKSVELEALTSDIADAQWVVIQQDNTYRLVRANLFARNGDIALPITDPGVELASSHMIMNNNFHPPANTIH